MSNLILFWHRRDLRITDNTGLSAARNHSPKVVGVFCLDQDILQRDDIAAVRVKYMIGCLRALERQYLALGSQLLILRGNPVQLIPALARALNAQGVYWNWDVEPYAQKRDLEVIHSLKEQGIKFIETNWDQLLHPPEQIRTGNNTPYTVYTPFWKNWIKQPKPEPAATLNDAVGLTTQEQEIAQQAGVISLPTARDLGFIWDQELIIAPGEQAAQTRLQQFTDDAIKTYQEQRNFPAANGTSQLSPALKFGVIGIRTVWHATTAAAANSNSEEVAASIQTWQQELAWREFYQHAMYNFPQLAHSPYRDNFKSFPWQDNPEHFEAWCQGKTGYPMVDAAMRQLNQTGWMHNRSRMIVASFLTKDLLINPQMGEKYFMQTLIDGDLSANNGGWQWSTSSGMDPKPLRIFNPASQAQKFDAEGEYIRRWIPELCSLDTRDLVTGTISTQKRQAIGYALPIIDHKVQQHRFKELYQASKLI